MAFALTHNNLNFETLELIIRDKPLLELPETLFAAEPTLSPSSDKNNLAQIYLEAHAVSFGPAVPEEIIRLALVLQFYPLIKNKNLTLAPAIIQRLLAFYNREVFPVVQQQCAAASQAAQFYLPLLGKGKISFQGYELNAADVNNIFSWEPIALLPEEVNYLVNQPIFTYAETTLNLIKLQPLLRWVNYLSDLFLQLAATEPLSAETEQIATALTQVKKLISANATLPVEQQNLGQLRDGLLELLTEINHVNEALAGNTTDTLENLFANAEPPFTTSFTLASSLVQSIQKQLAIMVSNPADIIFTRADINIINNLLAKAIVYFEQLTALAFWSVAQVGKIFNFNAGNITLSTYYHSSLFVPKEIVSLQLENIITYIRSTTPNSVT